MDLFENYSLKKHNTFGIDVKASEFFSFINIGELEGFAEKEFDNSKPFFILGGGSNVLFTTDYEGLVLHSRINTIKVVEEGDSSIILEVGSGVVWDDFVEFCVRKKYYGIENLSLIPGNVGAVPVQNIGAYGVEAKDFIENVYGYDLLNKRKVSFNAEECQFSYRNSVFKNIENKGIVITSVQFKLSKESYYKTKIKNYNGNWVLKRIKHGVTLFKIFFEAVRTLKFNRKKRSLSVDYGLLRDLFQNLGFVSLKKIRATIIKKRNSKIPHPTKVGNAGSFFKNPIIRLDKAKELKRNYPKAIIYPYSENESKVSAGWLIKECGWQYKVQRQVGLFKDQTLIIANLDNAKGEDIFDFSQQITKTVFNKFDILLEREVIVLNNVDVI